MLQVECRAGERAWCGLSNLGWILIDLAYAYGLIKINPCSTSCQPRIIQEQNSTFVISLLIPERYIFERNILERNDEWILWKFREKNFTLRQYWSLNSSIIVYFSPCSEAQESLLSVSVEHSTWDDSLYTFGPKLDRVIITRVITILTLYCKADLT